MQVRQGAGVEAGRTPKEERRTKGTLQRAALAKPMLCPENPYLLLQRIVEVTAAAPPLSDRQIVALRLLLKPTAGPTSPVHRAGGRRA
jgi:hypothetical protein